MADTDWKKRVGIQINYSPGQSSEEDDIVIRNSPSLPRGRAYQHVRAAQLLEDNGMGSDADLLGTTPPRARIRDKERKRQNMSENESAGGRLLSISRTKAVDSFDGNETLQNSVNATSEDKVNKRRFKIFRCRERDSKADWSVRADSMPSSANVPPITLVPAATLIETCNRFMSLSSKRVCPTSDPRAQSLFGVPADYEPTIALSDESIPSNRIQFHRMFSMLIKMGSSDKTCRRTISMEEQVWQNELKDLIWLEVRAKLAGQSPSQHDACLCAQRNIVPVLIQNVINYRFINANPCQKHKITTNSSGNSIDETSLPLECLSICCDTCSDVLGKALKEVGTLLDSFSNAESLYPSSKAMATHHPLVATQLFSNRLKALCLWYNIAYNLRLTILVMSKLLKILKHKLEIKEKRYGSESLCECASAELKPRNSIVSETLKAGGKKSLPSIRFEVDSNNPSESSSSAYSENSDAVTDCSKENDESDDSKPDSSYHSFNTDVSDSDINRTEKKLHTIKISGTKENKPIKNIDQDSKNEYTSNKTYKNLFEGIDFYNFGSLADVTHLKLYGNCETSPYRIYIESVLKTKGLRNSLKFVDNLYKTLLKRAHVTLQKYNFAEMTKLMEEKEEVNSKQGDSESEGEKYDPSTQDLSEEEKDNLEMKRFGCWSEESLHMKLPSYRSPFLFLAAIPLELIHEYMLFRLETRPEKPSALSIKQLIYEMKEGLSIAADSRARYVHHVDTALESVDPTGDTRRFICGVVRQFDNTIEKVFKQYTWYLSEWSKMEHLPRSILDTEWAFTLALTKKLKCAANMAPMTFCSIITKQLNEVANRINMRFSELDSKLLEMGFDESDKTEDFKSNNKKHFVLSMTREAQAIFADEQNITLGAAQFARILCCHLGPTIRSAPSTVQQINQLYKAMLNVACAIQIHMNRAEIVIAQAKDLVSDADQILQLRRVLLQGYKFGFDFHRELHYLVNEHSISHHPRGGNRLTGGHQADGGVVRRRHPLRRADSVGSASHSEVIAINKIVCRLSPSETQNFSTLTKDKQNSLDDANLESYLKNAEVHDHIHIKDVIAGKIDADNEETKPLSSLEFREIIAKKMIDFAKRWMKFVMELCERGRGLRPRWANNGLEFLMLACDPLNTKCLTDEEFEELKTMMDGCISHVVGSSKSSNGAMAPPKSPVPHRPAPAPPTSTPTSANASQFKVHLRHPQHTLHLNTTLMPVPPTPPTPPMEQEAVVQFTLPEQQKKRQERILTAISKVELSREEALRGQGCLGRAISNDPSSGGTTPEPKLRQLNFQWQRGIKIGAGRFGKVYTVVNTESGQLLAMKEVSLGPGDWKAVQKAANELKVLEGVLHPHLVRYFGCEIYREEMLIFMELCVEGSLDGLLAHVGAPGLPEQQVRRYTGQLISAVAELHNRQIAHRDIKTANIFLTNDGHCLKLGDFGCAVKIRANSTVPGELQGYVGTQAYMAPEVFMKSSGHGRLADVWSVGCVVTEMASGKRPFIEYDSNYQIMFMVGMGGRPEIPSQLSQEGQEFCMACLTHELSERPRAVELLDHHFLIVDQDGCNCQDSTPAMFSSLRKIKDNFE